MSYLIIRRFTFLEYVGQRLQKLFFLKWIDKFFMGRGQRRKFIVTQCQKALLLHWYEAVRIIYHRSKSNYLGLLSQYCNCGIYRVSTTADIGNDWLTPQTSVMLHHFSRLLLFSETIDETTSHPFERSNTQILINLKILKDSESFLAIWWVTFFF